MIHRPIALVEDFVAVVAAALAALHVALVFASSTLPGFPQSPAVNALAAVVWAIVAATLGLLGAATARASPQRALVTRR